MVFRLMLTAILAMVLFCGKAATALPDSLLTGEAAYRYMFVNPEKTKEIISTMRAQQKLPEWRLDLIEGNLCFSKCLFNKALILYKKSYESKEVQKNDSLKMMLLSRLLEVYDIKYDEKALPRYAHELYAIARSKHDTAYMSIALFVDGKRTHYQGNKKKGYERCLEAVELMKRTHFWRKNNVLRSYYGFLSKMYYDDKRYKEALKYSEAQEKFSSLPHYPEMLSQKERNLYRVYAIRANILMAKGREAEADKAYEKCVSLPIEDPFIIRNIVKYLSKRQRHEEAIPYIRKVKATLNEDSDTLSRNMVLLYYDAGDAYNGLQKYDSAAHYYAEAARMGEKIHSIRSRQLKESVNESIQLEREINRHERIQFYFYFGIAVLVIALIVYYFYAKDIRRGNKRMSQIIHTLMNYRYSTLYETNGNHNNTPKKTDEMGEKDIDRLKNDPNWQSFHQMDKQIVKNELFRQPDFGRDDLMRLMGVDKGTLATIIHQFTGTNVPGYINTKRMEYAILLIKMHPEYTLNAIADACGIKSPATFIRNFKNIYGMTPSEYREQIGAGDFTPPHEK